MTDEVECPQCGRMFLPRGRPGLSRQQVRALWEEAPTPCLLCELADALTPRPWTTEAACLGVADPDIFYPHGSGDSKARKAKRVCLGCPVRQKCLTWALANDERFGIWGGLTALERERLQEKRA